MDAFTQNLIIIGIIIIAAVIGIFALYRYIMKLDDKTSYQNYYSVDNLLKFIKQAFFDEINENLQEKNYNEKTYEAEKAVKKELRKAVRLAKLGDRASINFIKRSIRNKITNDAGINVDTIDHSIFFNNKSMLSTQDKFEILLHFFMKELSFKGENTNGAFSEMVNRYHLADEKIVTQDKYMTEKENSIDEADIDRVYDDYMSDKEITYEDKLDILCQRLFELYIGFGCIALLINSDIDEIDCGVSGIYEKGFDVMSISQGNLKELTFNYESIWIMWHGVNIHMKCLSFGREQELARICKNVSRYNAPNPLDKVDGRVMTNMLNGSRVVAVMPPFSSNGYCCFVRKFDSAPSVLPQVLLKEGEIGNVEPVIRFIKWLIMGQRNIAFTGQQGTGKTTTMKAMIRFIQNKYNIRVQEMMAELNLSFAYPNKNIVAFQETETVSMQEGLNIQKKTNGSINIIGEVADPETASYIVQTAKVASLFAMFTHHAKTTWDLVTAIRDNLLQTGVFQNEKAAEALCAEVLNFDVHMDKEGKERFIGHINEVVPIRDHRYPSEFEDNLKMSNAEKLKLDTIEYQKRVTDRSLFTVNPIFAYDQVNRTYVVKGIPTEEALTSMRTNISEDMLAEFDKDMDALKEMYLANKKKGIAA